MKIYLKDNSAPYRVSAPCPIPLRFQKPANAEIAKYIASGIISPCDAPTEWCSPAFFVPKGDGKRVHLVTDYTKLNRFVVRPVHPFPSVTDIIQSIPASAACFAKLDATHGYFQIPLDEEASKLTTFILPSGRFRYLRAPMGLSSSSDVVFLYGINSALVVPVRHVRYSSPAMLSLFHTIKSQSYTITQTVRSFLI